MTGYKMMLYGHMILCPFASWTGDNSNIVFDRSYAQCRVSGKVVKPFSGSRISDSETDKDIDRFDFQKIQLQRFATVIYPGESMHFQIARANALSKICLRLSTEAGKALRGNHVEMPGFAFILAD